MQLGHSTTRVHRNTYSLAAKRSIVREALAAKISPTKTNQHLFAIAKSHSVRPCQIRIWSDKFVDQDKRLNTPSTTTIFINNTTGNTTTFIDNTTTNTSIPPSNNNNVHDDHIKTIEEETLVSNDVSTLTNDEYSQVYEETKEQNGNKKNVLKLDALTRIDRIVYNLSVTRDLTRLVGAGRPLSFSKEIFSGLKSSFSNNEQ